jgi:hypothetical protein
MPSLDERFRIIDDMMCVFVQTVSEHRVKLYLKHLDDIPTDRLRAAAVGCVEQGQQRGVPTIADLRRRANELAQRETGSRLGQPVDGLKDRDEHAGTVQRLRDWLYCEHEISEVLRGQRAMPTEPKRFRFPERAELYMERMAEKCHTTPQALGITFPLPGQADESAAAIDTEEELMF